MVAYPLAGWLGEAAGFGTALIALCALAALGLGAAWHAWPAGDPMILAHRHDDLPVGHPHLREHPADVGALRHAHPCTIDDLHPRWPAGSVGSNPDLDVRETSICGGGIGNEQIIQADVVLPLGSEGVQRMTAPGRKQPVS